jgi:hypothetical protein
MTIGNQIEEIVRSRQSQIDDFRKYKTKVEQVKNFCESLYACFGNVDFNNYLESIPDTNTDKIKLLLLKLTNY